MGRYRLKVGKDTIDTSKVRRLEGGYRELTWRIRLDERTVLERKTRMRTRSDTAVRERARMRADELREQGLVTDVGGWSLGSDMGAYVREESMGAIRRNGFKPPLRPLSQERYLHLLELYAEQVDGVPIRSAVAPPNLRAAFAAVAEGHGTPTARKAASVASKYVMGRLQGNGIIQSNPLRGLDLELRQPDAAKPRRALTAGERHRCVDWLLSLDASELVPPRRGAGQGRYSDEQRQQRWEEARLVTLVQATCGLRINEALSLTRGLVGESGGMMTLEVTPEVSKTHRGRTVPVTDGRVAEAIRKRLDGSVGAGEDAWLFPSPAVPDHPWDRSNAHKTLRRLYDRMADALGIDELHDMSTHSWRRTLNTEWMEMGVPVELRAEYFGHDPSENRSTYTDPSHTATLVRMLRERGATGQ